MVLHEKILHKLIGIRQKSRVERFKIEVLDKLIHERDGQELILLKVVHVATSPVTLSLSGYELRALTIAAMTAVVLTHGAMHAASSTSLLSVSSSGRLPVAITIEVIATSASSHSSAIGIVRCITASTSLDCEIPLHAI